MDRAAVCKENEDCTQLRTDVIEWPDPFESRLHKLSVMSLNSPIGVRMRSGPLSQVGVVLLSESSPRESPCDTSYTYNARHIFVSVKYVLVSAKLVCVCVKLLKI
jgi:hypothetical protein